MEPFNHHPTDTPDIKLKLPRKLFLHPSLPPSLFLNGPHLQDRPHESGPRVRARVQETRRAFRLPLGDSDQTAGVRGRVGGGLPRGPGLRAGVGLCPVERLAAGGGGADAPRALAAEAVPGGQEGARGTKVEAATVRATDQSVQRGRCTEDDHYATG